MLTDANIDPRALGVAVPQGLVHRLERNPVAVVFALVVVAALAVLAYRFAIPWVAGKIAQRVPIAAEAKLGASALASLDGFALGPTQLSAERRAEIQIRFDRLAELANTQGETRLVFRNGQRFIGANALALPGGTVLITDQLVERTNSPDETAAVIAHELGHIANRHTMRHLLEQSASGLILGAVLGDVSGIGSLVAVAPALLLRLSFSRQNEQEADDFALALLPRAGLSASLLADSLEEISSPECSKDKVGTRHFGDVQQVARWRGEIFLPTYLRIRTSSRASRAHVPLRIDARSRAVPECGARPKSRPVEEAARRWLVSDCLRSDSFG